MKGKLTDKSRGAHLTQQISFFSGFRFMKRKKKQSETKGKWTWPSVNSHNSIGQQKRDQKAIYLNHWIFFQSLQWEASSRQEKQTKGSISCANVSSPSADWNQCMACVGPSFKRPKFVHGFKFPLPAAPAPATYLTFPPGRFSEFWLSAANYPRRKRKASGYNFHTLAMKLLSSALFTSSAIGPKEDTRSVA